MTPRALVLAVLAACCPACSGGTATTSTPAAPATDEGVKALPEGDRAPILRDVVRGPAASDGGDLRSGDGNVVVEPFPVDGPPPAGSCRVREAAARPMSRLGELVLFSHCAGERCEFTWARVDELEPADGAPPTWILTGGTRERGEFFADCGAWGECVTGVALPCGDGHLTLVLPLDYRWQLEPDRVQGGMWSFREAHRAGSAIEEMVPGGPPPPRVTHWEWHDDAYVPRPRRGTCEPTVTEVLFVPGAPKISVTIRGDGFCVGAGVPTASFGELALERVTVRSSGDAMSGFLPRMPAPGARLRLHTPPGAPVDTGYVAP